MMSAGIQRLGDFEADPQFPIISKVVVHGGLVYTCGVVADPVGDITQQTRQALERVDELLHLGGSDRSRILSAQVWLADMADFAAHNAVWDAWVDSASPPVRACVGASLYDRRVLVEIRVVAAVGDQTHPPGGAPGERTV
jgi:enamine deaminase RidA (YjgF/YER057c/UK114 family)